MDRLHKNKIPIYLASRSPRRRKLLKILNLSFKSFSVDTDESISNGEHPIKAVKRLATEKMNAAKNKIEKGIVITADTIVVLKDSILGKPIDADDAVRILKTLSGNTHIVYTGYAIFNSVNNKTIVEYEKTFVTFRKLDDDEIENYVESGSPLDKAGAYGIQDDFGAVFVEKINGCYYNVVGLPLSKLYKSLKEII